MIDGLTPGASAAVASIRAALPDVAWSVTGQADGGAVMIGEGLPLGAPWAHPETWIGFRVPFNVPYADVYPHFVRGDLQRADGGPIGEALSQAVFEGRPAIQISRASRRRDPGLETPLVKLLKVISWLRDRQ